MQDEAKDDGARADEEEEEEGCCSVRKSSVSIKPSSHDTTTPVVAAAPPVGELRTEDLVFGYIAGWESVAVAGASANWMLYLRPHHQCILYYELDCDYFRGWKDGWGWLEIINGGGANIVIVSHSIQGWSVAPVPSTTRTSLRAPF